MKLLVSILIPAYNAEKYIEQCIESALAQTYEPTEIIVVDDGSKDATYDLASKYLSKKVKVYRQSNKGASAARNLCFEKSSGQYIQFLDADDLLDKEKIELQMLEATDQDRVVSGAWAFFLKSTDKARFDATKLWKSYDRPIDWLITAWTEGVWMHPASWLVPRALVEGASGWDERISLHDDGEFFSRVLLASTGTIFVKEAKAYYRKGIENSLSSIISLKAVNSHFQVCNLYTQNILKVEDSKRTRHACAVNFMNFHFEYFPKYRSLRKKALARVNELGGTTVKPKGTKFFYILSKLLGWKLARIFERFYYGNKLNAGAWKERWNKLANKDVSKDS